jgi:hypothetical protein
MKMAGIRKYGKTTLFTDINQSDGIHWGKNPRDGDDSGKETRERGIDSLE